MTSPYTEQQKAEAIALSMAGASSTEISDRLGIPAGTVRSWVSRAANSVALVATDSPARTHAEQLRDDMAAMLHAQMVALTRQMEHYGSEEWIKGKPAEAVLESTRAITRGIVAVMDRLGGNAGAGPGPERDGNDQQQQD